MRHQVFVNILAMLFFILVSVPASAETVTDPAGLNLLTDMYNEVEKTCPEKDDQAAAKEQEFGLCSQQAYTSCMLSTKPEDPSACAAPATAQCRSIIDEFLKTCTPTAKPPTPTPTCGENEEVKDGKCVCKEDYERVLDVCRNMIVEGSVVIEYRVLTMTVKKLKGDVRVQHAGQGEQEAAKNTELKEGDEIFAGFDSEAVLETDNGDVITLKSNTQIRLAGKDEKKFNIKLEAGEVKIRIKVMTGPTRPDVRIQTPTVTTSVRGTEFVIRVAADGASDVFVSEGTVAVTQNEKNEEVLVNAGQKISGTATDLGDVLPMTTEDETLFRDQGLPWAAAIIGGIALLVILCLLVIWRRRQKSQ